MWDTTHPNWRSAIGAVDYWSNGKNAHFDPTLTAIFTNQVNSSAVIGDVTVSGSVQVNGVTFFGNAFTVSGGEIILGSEETDFNVANQSTQTIASQIVDPIVDNVVVPNKLRKSGHGMLVVTNTGNDYAGTIIADGSAPAILRDGIAFLPGALGEGAVTVDAGANKVATLMFIAGDDDPSALPGGLILTSGVARLDMQNNQIGVTGTISGSGALEVGDTLGGGWLKLAAVNTYTGGTIIHSGTLNVESNDNLGDDEAALNIVFGGNAVFQWGAGFTVAETRPISIDPDCTATLDTQEFSCGIAGTIEGEGNLRVIGSGTLTLSGTNTFTGVTTIDAADETLVLANSAALGGSTFDTDGPGTLSVGSLTEATFGGLQGAGDLTLPSGFELTVGGNGDNTSFAGNLAGNITLTKTGSGVLVLSGDNAIAELIAHQGIIVVDSPDAFPEGMVLAFDADSTAVIQLNGNDVTLAGLTTDATTPGTPVIENSPESEAAPATLIVYIDSRADTFAGRLRDGAGEVPLALAQIGDGDLTLDGNNNTFTGRTTVAGGSLYVTHANGLADGAALTVGDPTAFGEPMPASPGQQAASRFAFTGGEDGASQDLAGDAAARNAFDEAKAAERAAIAEQAQRARAVMEQRLAVFRVVMETFEDLLDPLGKTHGSGVVVAAGSMMLEIAVDVATRTGGRPVDASAVDVHVSVAKVLEAHELRITPSLAAALSARRDAVCVAAGISEKTADKGVLFSLSLLDALTSLAA